MPSYDSTARVPFKTGGSVKKPKVKRIILWKGKAKDWPGAKEAARQTRNRKADGGRIGLKKGSVNVPGSHSWWLLQQSKPRRSKKAEGGKARDYKKELAKWNSPENRKKRQKEYLEKHGPRKPRRKTLGVTDPYKKIREQRKFSEAGFKPLRA